WATGSTRSSSRWSRGHCGGRGRRRRVATMNDAAMQPLGRVAAAHAPPVLTLRGVGKSFDATDDTPAIRGIDLDVGQGEFLAIVGPSGCGKSTLLQICAGLLPASTGEVRLNGAPVTSP